MYGFLQKSFADLFDAYSGGLQPSQSILSKHVTNLFSSPILKIPHSQQELSRREHWGHQLTSLATFMSPLFNISDNTGDILFLYARSSLKSVSPFCNDIYFVSFLEMLMAGRDGERETSSQRGGYTWGDIQQTLYLLYMACFYFPTCVNKCQ